eukprot:scaffold81834_cov13-Prasinocladus_malaysianus.AAC.1
MSHKFRKPDKQHQTAREYGQNFRGTHIVCDATKTGPRVEDIWHTEKYMETINDSHSDDNIINKINARVNFIYDNTDTGNAISLRLAMGMKVMP